MKLRYLLPFYALLIGISFCCRKISNEKEEAEAAKEAPKEQQLATAPTTAPDPITGILELDESTNTIYADLYINVPNANFQFDNDFMDMETTNKYKGISFRYHDHAENTKDNGEGTDPLHITFSFDNDKKWVENDSIRIMSLDEDEKKVYLSLTPYFELRMNHFKNSATTYSALTMFNHEWNTNHPGNPVYPDTDESGKKYFTPRISKDDSILLLKLKKK